MLKSIPDTNVIIHGIHPSADVLFSLSRLLASLISSIVMGISRDGTNRVVLSGVKNSFSTIVDLLLK